jgi:hypothetical protein
MNSYSVKPPFLFLESTLLSWTNNKHGKLHINLTVEENSFQIFIDYGVHQIPTDITSLHVQQFLWSSKFLEKLAPKAKNAPVRVRHE